MTNDVSFWTNTGTTEGDDSSTGRIVFRELCQPNIWYEECVKRIAELSHLPENWDSYGAAAPSTMSISRSHHLLGVVAYVDAVPKPKITLSPDGDINFVFEDGIAYVEIDVHPSCYDYFREQNEDVTDGSTLDLKKLVDTITKM